MASPQLGPRSLGRLAGAARPADATAALYPPSAHASKSNLHTPTMRVLVCNARRRINVCKGDRGPLRLNQQLFDLRWFRSRGGTREMH